MPNISVIVATRNRRRSLAEFFDALCQLPRDPSWELVVADNGSTDGTAEFLATMVDSLPVIAVTEPRPGKSRALNLALSHARGDLLVFTDDDVIPDRRWLSAMHRAAGEYPTANVFGGRILVDRQFLPEWLRTARSVRTMLTSEQDLGTEVQWYSDNQYPAGPNLAVRRRLLQGAKHLWPVDLGPGTKIPLGDERGFLTQLSPPQAGDRLYVPESVVRHAIAGRRLDFGSAVVRCFLGGYAAGRFGSYDARGLGTGSVTGRAWRRLRNCGSSAELVCNCARAFGLMLAGCRPAAPKR
jgi:glycosyltransferase involved in cell wall biosynthesis